MITTDNFTYSVFRWRDRQAGVSLIFDPEFSRFTYNAYCTETKILKELFGCEFEFLDDALELVNSEFGNWELVSLEAQSGCSSCAAKKH